MGKKKKSLNTVTVPEDFYGVFLKAQEYVESYFSKAQKTPEKGSISFSGERYILIRAASISKEFFDMMMHLYRDRGEKEARSLSFNYLFDMAHSIGKADAKSFFSKMKVDDPIEKLSAGPVHFAYTGWASVNIYPMSNPTPDENFYLIYDHPYSFEADTWIEKHEKTDFAVCVMNAGYSSGWCEESFGIPLVTFEIECRAKGDRHCRFIMAPPSRIKEYIDRYQKHEYVPTLDAEQIDIPEFFIRKRLEDELIKSEETVRALLNAPSEQAFLLDRDGKILALNEPAALALHSTIDDLVGKNAFHLIPAKVAKKRRQYHQQVFASCKSVRYEDLRDGKWMDTTVDPVPDAKGNVMCVAVFSRDMTEQKNLEAELRNHKNHLEALVEKRTEKLSQANRQLEFEVEEHNQSKIALLQSETMLQAIFDQTFEYIGLLDLKGRVIKINNSALRLVGTKEKSITGQPLWETPLWNHSKKEQQKIKKAVKKAGRGELVRFETVYNDQHQERTYIDFSLKPVIDVDGKIIYLVAEGHDITNLKTAVSDLEENESILKLQSKNLEESNIALKVVLKQMEQKEKQDKENFLLNIKQTVLPYLNKLKESNLSQGQKVLTERLELNLDKITSPLVSKLSSKYLNLTPMEIKVATLVKDGLVNKDIADLLNISVNTVTSHRYKIRTKLGLKKKSINLRSYLLSLER